VQSAVSPVIRSWCKGPVGVEKLFPAKFAKIKSRQGVLQTTFSVFLDIFYPPNFGYFEEEWSFSTSPTGDHTQCPSIAILVSNVGNGLNDQRSFWH
jgi:hypothetical protein